MNLISITNCMLRIAIRFWFLCALCNSHFVHLEFVDEHWTEMSCNDESACFCFRNNPDRWVGVSLLKNYYGYAFTSDSLSTLFVCVKQTLTRCAVHQGAAKDKKIPHVFTYTSVPTHQLFSIITDRVTTRNEIKRLEVSLSDNSNIIG